MQNLAVLMGGGGDVEAMKLKMMCWNVAGWSRGDGIGGDRVVESRDIGAKVINFSSLI